MLDLEVEVESLRDRSMSIQQYQIVELGSPQKSRSLKAVSRIDLNAATSQDASAHVTGRLVGVDEENFLTIENRATKWGWLVHTKLPKPKRVG